MKSFIGIVFLLLSLLTTKAQESYRFEWEIDDAAYPLEGELDSDSNIVIVGRIAKLEQGSYFNMDGFIFKLLQNGEYLYYRYVSAPDSSCIFSDVIQLDNGNYLSIGVYSLTEYPPQNKNVMVCIFDQDLNLLTEKHYQIPEGYINVAPQKLLREDSGTILLASSIKPENANILRDFLFYRFDENGDTIQTHIEVFPSNLSGISIYDVDKIPGSGNYMILDFNTHAFGDFECYIIRPDLTLETRNYHASFDYNVETNITACYWYPDNNFILGGGFLDMTKWTDYALGVYKCDTLANVIDYISLNKVDIYDRQGMMNCMAYGDENSIYIAGFMADFWDCDDPDSIELYVVDTALNQIAYKSLGGEISYDVVGVMTAPDKGVIIYGIAWYPEGNACMGNLVIYHVSRKDLGLTTEIYDIERDEDISAVYPNPATEAINIPVDSKLLNSRSRIRIFNNYGRKVYDYKLPDIGNTIHINIKNLERGFYTFKIITNDKIIKQGKFVKQ